VPEPFAIGRLPRIEFGIGSLDRVPQLAAGYGRRALLVTGARSLAASGYGDILRAGLTATGVDHEDFTVDGEPSPQTVDEAVSRYRDKAIDLVIGVGGGSALDTAKAIAGLLQPGNSVMDHLEGVGPELDYQGPATPLIAVPTTAGTGSEATRNAVLSVQGEDGFKKSFRDDALVAQWAVVDPRFLETCPPAQIAANGMDALTQLMESYVSARANDFVDALALDGIKKVRDGFLHCHAGGGSTDAQSGRAAMSYAALLSGITLAQVGLGSVHGLASPLGAFFPIPHGVVCGTLVAEATRMNIHTLREREPDHPALDKYARLGAVLGGADPKDRESAWQVLVEVLADWTERLEIPRLSRYGVGLGDIRRIVLNSRGSSMKTNPVVLRDDEIAAIVERRL
jgi:alcohol dehydrogenase